MKKQEMKSKNNHDKIKLDRLFIARFVSGWATMWFDLFYNNIIDAEQLYTLIKNLRKFLEKEKVEDLSLNEIIDYLRQGVASIFQSKRR